MARPIDDGRLSVAFLQSKAARQVHDVVEVSLDSPAPGSGVLNSTVVEVGISVVLAGRDSFSADEGPFGHGGHLDEPQPCPRGASRRGSIV